MTPKNSIKNRSCFFHVFSWFFLSFTCFCCGSPPRSQGTPRSPRGTPPGRPCPKGSQSLSALEPSSPNAINANSLSDQRDPINRTSEAQSFVKCCCQSFSCLCRDRANIKFPKMPIPKTGFHIVLFLSDSDVVSRPTMIDQMPTIYRLRQCATDCHKQLNGDARHSKTATIHQSWRSWPAT